MYALGWRDSSKAVSREVSEQIHSRNRLALKLFDGIAGNYHGPARAFSLWQYDRWHSILVSRLGDLTGKRVLDMSTGTGLVARRIARRWSTQVVAVDISHPMLVKSLARAKGEELRGHISLIQGQAEAASFADETFDAVVFTYLLRYVEDVPATLVELARLLKPGGMMAALEFGVPSAPWLRVPWLAYTHLLIPCAMYPISSGWRRVGAFLGPSIRRFCNQYPLERQVDLWKAAGLKEVEIRTPSLGGAVVMWGYKS